MTNTPHEIPLMTDKEMEALSYAEIHQLAKQASKEKDLSVEDLARVGEHLLAKVVAEREIAWAVSAMSKDPQRRAAAKARVKELDVWIKGFSRHLAKGPGAKPKTHRRKPKAAAGRYLDTIMVNNAGSFFSILVWDGEKDYAIEPPEHLIDLVPKERRAKVFIAKSDAGEDFGVRTMRDWHMNSGASTLVVWARDSAAFDRVERILSEDTYVPPPCQ